MTENKYGCMKKFWNISYFGGLVGTIFFFITLVIYVILQKPGEEIGAIFLGLLFYGIVPGGLGFYFRKKFAKAEENYKKALIQRMLFTLAKQNNGIVKISDVALSLEITYEEAQEMLAGVSTSGIAQAEVDDDGFVYYTFPEFKN